MTDSVQRIALALAGALEPLRHVVADAEALEAGLNMLGWQPPSGVDLLPIVDLDLTSLLAALRGVVEATAEDQRDTALMIELFARLIAAVGQTVAGIDRIAGNLPAALAAVPDYVDRTKIAQELPRRLLDTLVAGYVGMASPAGFETLRLIGLIRHIGYPVDPTIFQVAHTRNVVAYERLQLLISDPGRLLVEEYGWGTDTFDAHSLLDRLTAVARAVGLRARRSTLSPKAETQLFGAPRLPAEPATQAVVSLVRALGPGAPEVGLTASGLQAPDTNPSDAGIAVMPFVFGGGVTKLALDEHLSLEIEGDVDIAGGLLIQLRPSGVAIRTGVATDGTGAAGTAKVGVGLHYLAPPQESLVLLSLPGGSRLEANELVVRVGTELTPEGLIGASVELGLLKGRLLVTLSGADGFLAQALPDEGLMVDFELDAAWSTHLGLHVRGGVGLEATLPVHAVLGPVRIPTVFIRLAADSDGIRLVAAVSAAVALGPVNATAERLGLELLLAFPGGGGNLGPANLAAQFKPPDGAGLSISAGPVVGGGYLFFDRVNRQYAGALQLEFKGIALKAVGIITTRMPDGTDGFSMLLIISAEFTPIQLGYGFTLNGVGGLIGVNRTVALDVLRGGIKAGTLNSIMFPADPVANAPQLISDLSAVFPPSPGRFVIGPMARLGWGTPTLLTLDLGLILELPPPVRLAVLGRLRMTLPDAKAAVIVINMDVLGVLDFQRGEVSIDATLYDSRIAAFGLTGDMALRAGWGDRPGFALSIGGFHPRFQPPPNFPRLSRLALSLCTGDNPRLRLESYLALTSNTVQFGARLELYAGAAGFSVEGMLAFDALFQFDPFMVLLEIAGSVSLKFGGRVLMGISIKLALSGPSPWHATGRARFEILFFSAEVSFDVTLGGEAPQELPSAVEVLPLVEAAFADMRNWTAQLPAEGESLVSLREIPRAENVLLIHPLGAVAVSQRVAPLGRTLQRLGNAQIADATRLDITSVRIGAAERLTDPVDEYFAPAQFLDLTDDEKLARPSFERWEGGRRVRAAGSGRDTSPPIEASPVPTTKIIDAPDAVPRDAVVPPVPPLALRRAFATSAAAHAPTRRRGPGRYAGPSLGLEVEG